MATVTFLEELLELTHPSCPEINILLGPFALTLIGIIIMKVNFSRKHILHLKKRRQSKKKKRNNLREQMQLLTQLWLLGTYCSICLHYVFVFLTFTCLFRQMIAHYVEKQLRHMIRCYARLFGAREQAFHMSLNWMFSARQPSVSVCRRSPTFEKVVHVSKKAQWVLQQVKIFWQCSAVVVWILGE